MLRNCEIFESYHFESLARTTRDRSSYRGKRKKKERKKKRKREGNRMILVLVDRACDVPEFREGGKIGLAGYRKSPGSAVIVHRFEASCRPVRRVILRIPGSRRFQTGSKGTRNQRGFQFVRPSCGTDFSSVRWPMFSTGCLLSNTSGICDFEVSAVSTFLFSQPEQRADEISLSLWFVEKSDVHREFSSSRHICSFLKRIFSSRLLKRNTV